MAKTHFTFNVHLAGINTPVEETVTVEGADMRKAQVILENRYPQAALISFKNCKQEEYQRQYVDQVAAPAAPARAAQPTPAGGNGGGGAVAGVGLLLVLAVGGIGSLFGGEAPAPAPQPERETIEQRAVAPVVRTAPGYEPIVPAGEPAPLAVFDDTFQEEAIDDLGQNWDN